MVQAAKTLGLQDRRCRKASRLGALMPNMDVALVSASHTMPAVTFCNLPLSTMFNHNLEKSLLSLEWLLTSGVPTVITVSGPSRFRIATALLTLSVISKYSCWLPPFFYLTLFLAVTGIFVETHEACIYLALGVFDICPLSRSTSLFLFFLLPSYCVLAPTEAHQWEVPDVDASTHCCQLLGMFSLVLFGVLLLTLGHRCNALCPAACLKL
jgi:hypothetical protein